MPSIPATKPFSHARCSCVKGADSGMKTCVHAACLNALTSERAELLDGMALRERLERSRPAMALRHVGLSRRSSDAGSSSAGTSRRISRASPRRSPKPPPT